MPRTDATALSKRDLAHFKLRLSAERKAVFARLQARVETAVEDTDGLADEFDVASRSQDQAFLLRLADKERKLLIEIDRALSKLEDGTYGLCEGTGEPIGKKRLDARPWARYSVEHKERLEREHAQHRRG
jgi:DnaK suppressor protein